MEALAYRRQFILGPRPLYTNREWQTHNIGQDKFVLQVHQELSLTQIAIYNRELTLLGDILDPTHPNLNIQSILSNIGQGLDRGGDIFQLTEGLGGRWILVLDETDSTIIFSDPCALRQVFYSDSTQSETWCASQFVHISRALELSINPDFQSNFLDSSYAKTDKEYWFPGDITPYSGIRRLLPNHVLNIQHKQSHRYWPNLPIESMNFNEAVKRVTKLLKGQIEAGAN